MADEDLFPTRLDSPKPIFPRIDRVVHSKISDRWSGPLSEVALSAYERDGFLWIKGFFSRERVEPFFEELQALTKDETKTKH